MNVLLIDIDGKLPNLALMKWSAWFKQTGGGDVGFQVVDPQIIKASVVFRANKALTSGLCKMYPGADIQIGGSGYDLKNKLPIEVERMVPYWSLYDGLVCRKCHNLVRACTCLSHRPTPGNLDYSLNYCSRGCVRQCYFCDVWKKEGKLYHEDWMHPSVWHDLNRFKRTKLLDNNWYADPDWFFETSQWFIDNKVAVDVTQGFDIRLITPEIAAQLKKLKRWAPFHFAFDDMAIKDDVLNGLEILKQAGFDTKHHLSFYVYCHNDKQYPDAVERCQILKAHRTTAFAMCNIDRPRSKRMDKLMRWTGRSWLFWSCDIDDYDGKVKGHVGMQAEGLA